MECCAYEIEWCREEQEKRREAGYICFQKHCDALAHHAQAPVPPSTAMEKEL
jgi:hypothetical protein